MQVLFCKYLCTTCLLQILVSFRSVQHVPFFLTTQCQYRVSLLSPGVSKILTACRFKKTLMLGYVQKAEMHSFPNMPIMGGVALVEVGQKKDFLQKSAEKTAFLRDTNRDHLTLEGHNSLNFKDFRLSQGCFGKFGT